MSMRLVQQTINEQTEYTKVVEKTGGLGLQPL